MHATIDIEEMIRRESDPEKRAVLLVMLNITGTLVTVTKILEELKRDHTSRITDHQRKIEDHDDVILEGRTVLKTLTAIFTIVQGAGIGFFFYGYSLVAELRDKVNEQGVLFPRLERLITENKAPDVSKDVSSIKNQLGELQQNTEQVDKIHSELSKIKRLRVIRDSR